MLNEFELNDEKKKLFFFLFLFLNSKINKYYEPIQSRNW